MRALALALAVIGALLTAPFAVAAQPAGKMARVGVVTGESEQGAGEKAAVFRKALRELGHVEGQTIALELRHGKGRGERFAGLVAELLRIGVDVLVVQSTPAAMAAKQATRTTPIVFVVGGNPVETGLVQSLARPGGNLTGLSSAIDDQFSGKFVELLKEAAPRLSRVAVLRNPDTPVTAAYVRHMEAAAGALGVRLKPVLVQSPDTLDGAFAAMIKEGAGGLIVDPTVFFTAHYPRVVALAAKHRLPAIYAHREAVDAGGLMYYGSSATDRWRRAAVYVDRILRGARPADLPVEEAMKFELVINLETAKALGLTIPQSLRLRADHVIE